MTRVLLFGASGQVGTAIRSLLGESHDVVAPESAHVNLLDTQKVAEFIRNIGPGLVINAAAYTKVDEAESNRDLAFRVNAEAPGAIASATAEVGAKLVHLSTDYVFDGEGDWPYDPEAPTNPVNVYGASKRTGEESVLQADPGAIVLRTSWVHGGGSENFVTRAVRSLGSGSSMAVVSDQIGAPTRARHVARAALELGLMGAPGGVVHFTDAGVASWYDVACCVLDELRSAGASVMGAAVVPVRSDAVPRAARRPRASLLDSGACWNALGWTPPHWQEGVRATIREELSG